MQRGSEIARRVLTTTLLLLMGVLVLQALAYGVSFVVDPAAGVAEFAYARPTVVEDLTIELVGIVGVGMVGIAALLMLSMGLVWRGQPAGAYVAVICGAVYFTVGVRAFSAGWSWDAYFYTLTGAFLMILSIGVRLLQSRASV